MWTWFWNFMEAFIGKEGFRIMPLHGEAVEEASESPWGLKEGF